MSHALRQNSPQALLQDLRQPARQPARLKVIAAHLSSWVRQTDCPPSAGNLQKPGNQTARSAGVLDKTLATEHVGRVTARQSQRRLPTIAEDAERGDAASTPPTRRL